MSAQPIFARKGRWGARFGSGGSLAVIPEKADIIGTCGAPGHRLDSDTDLTPNRLFRGLASGWRAN